MYHLFLSNICKGSSTDWAHVWVWGSSLPDVCQLALSPEAHLGLIVLRIYSQPRSFPMVEIRF